MKTENLYYPHRLLSLVSETGFIKLVNILSEPNFFRIVGRTHYERWHSCFLGWLLDKNGSHLLHEYVLSRFLLLLHDDKALKSSWHNNNELIKFLPTIEFKSIDVTPNEFVSTETSIKNVGRFDIFLTAEYFADNNTVERINIIFELKIDSRIDFEQSKRYANWIEQNHPNDTNILIYLLPRLLSDSKATVGDERWYCLNYQLVHDKLLSPIIDHPNLNPKVELLVLQYIKNLKSSHKGIKMAITEEEKRLSIDLYEKYKDVFDTIYDALLEANAIDYSTSDLTKGRKSGRLAVKLDNRVFEGDMVKTLFKNILEYLVDSKIIDKIPLPWGTGTARYIVTNEELPIHPNGNEFFTPVKYKGYTIETHYARERAIAVLDSLCQKLEIDFEQIEV